MGWVTCDATSQGGPKFFEPVEPEQKPKAKEQDQEEGGDSEATAAEGDKAAKLAGESVEAVPKAGKGPAKGGKSKGPPAPSKGGDAGATAAEGDEAAKLAGEESVEAVPKAGKGPAKGGKSKGPPAPNKGGASSRPLAEDPKKAKEARMKAAAQAVLQNIVDYRQLPPSSTTSSAKRKSKRRH
eukprot:s730_g28.t1